MYEISSTLLSQSSQSDGDNQPDNRDLLEYLLEQQKLQGILMCPTRYIGPFDQYSKISRHTSITIYQMSS